jgi:hypothetical protein
MTQRDRDDVGYGRPPTHSRFKKGKSGNPSGRPKAVPSFRSDLLQELQVPHPIHEDGQVTTVTKHRALVKSLTAAALNNDMRAVNMLLTLMRHYGVDSDGPAPEDSDFEDLDALQTYIDNQRKHQTQHEPKRAKTEE